jgi:Putative metallopeptidase
MRYALPLIALALAVGLPAHAGGTKDDFVATRNGGSVGGPGRATGTGHRDDPGLRFVQSNITETLYHELGHVLIDVLDLPVFGPEEFAVDLFAIVMMNRMHDEDAVVAMTYDVAAAYDAGAMKERTAGDAPAMWDVHGSDRQRYYNLVCHMYGANPDGRDDVAEELGLPEARMHTCEDEYALTARAWGGVLDDLAVGAPGTSFKMDWMLDAESPVTKYVAAEVARLNAVMVLPEEVSVSVISCGEVNAFYDPGPREIIICTEMAEHLAELAR